MTLLVVANAKGGSAKTTTATSLASALANLHDTLLVDLDSQGHCSLAYGLPVRSGLFDWIVRGLPLRDCTLTGRPAPADDAGLMILPGDSLTAQVELQHASRDRFTTLVNRLATLPLACTHVVCDTSSRGICQEAALAAADQLVVPFRCELRDIDGIYQLLEKVKQLNPPLLDRRAITLLPVVVDMRLRRHRENLAGLVAAFGVDYGLLPDPEHEHYVIPDRAAVLEAGDYQQTIWECKARGIEDVKVGYTWLMNRVLEIAVRLEAEEEIESEVRYG